LHFTPRDVKYRMRVPPVALDRFRTRYFGHPGMGGWVLLDSPRAACGMTERTLKAQVIRCACVLALHFPFRHDKAVSHSLHS